MNDIKDTTRLGILCMLVGMFFISVNDAAFKGLADRYPLHELVFFRTSIGLVLTVFIMMWEGGFALLRTGRPGLHILRALLVVFANSAIYAAIAAMPLATVNAIYFIAPLLVTLMSIPVLGERVGPRRFAAILVGFGGVVLMVLPEVRQAQQGDGVGWIAVLPLLAAFGYAGMSVLTRKLGQVSRASVLALHIQFAFMLVSLGFFVVAGDGRFVDEGSGASMQFLLRAWVWPQAQDVPMLIGLGCLSAIIGYTLSQAYRLARAAVVAPFEYILLIYALIWGWAVFDEWPAPTVFWGAGVVIAAGIYVFVRQDQLQSEP